jgi:Tol biopolymer transport system component
LDPTGTPDWEIRAAALDGSSDVAITLGANDDQNPRFDFNPAWSPNGSELVYASECCTGGTDILVADAMVKGQGGLVAFGNVFADDPDWSPDGSAIAFDDNAQIWTARPDGSQLTLLNPSGARPRYSPDGARIAFSSTAPQAGIYVMNADGTGVALLAANGAVPTWSPDGTTIAFLRSDGIWTMSSDGSSQHRIVATGNVTSISWQPLPSPPQNYGAPLVSGVPQLGQLLTTTTGRWASFNAQAVTYTYQWQRCNSATCTNIQGATGATYIPVAADADRTLRVVVRARNLVGGSDKSSAQTGPIRRH